MASDITSVHLALGLLDQHSFKTLEQAVQQFKDHKQRFHESLFELKSLKPLAIIPPDPLSHPSSHDMQTRCTLEKLPTGEDSLGVLMHLKCTPSEPPLDSTSVQDGTENHSYSLRPRASQKHSSSGAPQRITRSRAKQPATTSTGVASNNSRKSGFIVLEDDFVQVRAKGKRKPGQHQQTSFQHEYPLEAAVLGDAKAFPDKSSEKLGPSGPSFQDVTVKTAHSLQELLTPSSTKRFEHAGKETSICQDVVSSQKQLEKCTGELQTPSSLKRFRHVDKETFSFVQQISLINKGHSASHCPQNTVSSNKNHRPVMHKEWTSARSCSRNHSIDTNAAVTALSPPACIHLPTSVDQSSKQINDAVQCEVNLEKQLSNDAEDGTCISCLKEPVAFGIKPKSMTVKDSLFSPCQKFNGIETRQYSSHKRKLSVFGSPANGFVPSNNVKRRKRTSGSINSIEVEAFKFDINDSFSVRKGCENVKFTAGSLCKVNKKSLCAQGDVIQARRSAFRELSTPGIKNGFEAREVGIKGGETGFDWHVNSVSLEMSCGILSQGHDEGAGTRAHAAENTLQDVDLQEGKPASPGSYHQNNQTLDQAHEKIEAPNDSSRNTYIKCNSNSQCKAAEEQNSVVPECALPEQLLSSDLRGPAICFLAKEQLEQENLCPLPSKNGLVRTSLEVQPYLHELPERLSTPGIDDSAEVEEFSFAQVMADLECHPNCVISEKPCGMLSLAHCEAAGCGAYAWDDSLQADSHEGKPALPDPVPLITQKLHQAHEMIEPYFERESDTCAEECSKEFQSEASEKQDSLVLECAHTDQSLLANLNSPAVFSTTKVQPEQEKTSRSRSKSGLLLATPAEVQACLPELAEGLHTPGINNSSEDKEPSIGKGLTGLDCHANYAASVKRHGILSQPDYEAAGCEAHGWDDNLQGVLKGSQERKPAVPDSFQATPQKLHQACDMIDIPFEHSRDTQIKECSNQSQAEAHEKEDDLVLECAHANQLKLSDSQPDYEAAECGVHGWDDNSQGVLKASQERKPAVPDSFQVTPQKLHQACDMIDIPFEHSRYTQIKECSNQSQVEAHEKEDDLVLECAHADQLQLSDLNSPAFCFPAKLNPEQEALASRNTVVTDDLAGSDGFDSLHRLAMGSQTNVVTDRVPNSNGFDSLRRQAISSHKKPSRLSGLRRDCIDTPHMKAARAGLVARSSPNYKNFEWHLEACLEDGKENQIPEICLKDKVYSSKCLLSERQATPGSRKKVLGCSNQSLGGLVNSTHKRYNLAVETRSFLDLVHQKQLPLPYPNGKREVRVKALEAAELARRQEERRENERKMRRLESNEVKDIELENCKDKMTSSCPSTLAMKGVTEKVKRVAELKLKMDLEKAKKHEVDQKRKEEERKKKEAEFADKKRKREDAERKDREEKRKRVEEVQKFKKEQEERQRLELEEKEHKRKVLEERERERKAQEEEAKKLRRLQKEREAERRRKQEQNLKASRLAEKQADRKRKEAMQKTRGFEDDAIAQLGLGNKLSLLSSESFAVSSSTDWEVQSKSKMRTRSQASEDRWGLCVPSLGASVYCQTNNRKLSRSACFNGNGTPFPVSTIIQEELKFEPPKGLKSQYATPYSLRLGAYAQQTQLESNNQTYEISPYKSSSDDDDDEDNQQKKPIPLWARKENLLSQILWQQCMDPDDIFSTEKTCSLADIFGTAGSRRCKDFAQRSASGDWLCDYASRKEELDYKKAMGYIQT